MQKRNCIQNTPVLNLEPDLIPLRDRDRALMEDLDQLLDGHRILRNLSLTYIVRGGVVHMRGRVPSSELRHMVRRLVSRLRGVHALWDALILPGEDTIRVIDIGCGNHKQLHWATGVDRHPYEGVDVVADLEKGLPFSDNEIDHIYAIHILEHVVDITVLMNEIHRVLKPGGLLHVMVPNSQCINAIADPTHVRFFNLKTFRYFCEPRPGLAPFYPLLVSGDHENILADLEPVKDNANIPSPQELSRYFD